MCKYDFIYSFNFSSFNHSRKNMFTLAEWLNIHFTLFSLPLSVITSNSFVLSCTGLRNKNEIVFFFILYTVYFRLEIVFTIKILS